MDYSTERQVAREAALLAARLCVAVRDQMVEGDRMEKAGREPVTVADYGSQAVILKLIAENFPGDQVIAEERSQEFQQAASAAQRENVLRYVREAVGDQHTLDEVSHWLDFGRSNRSPRVWAIDPIDGTKGFLRGDQFAIAIALLVNGLPTVSVLACPLLPLDQSGKANAGCLGIAIKQQGAILETLDGSGQRRLVVSSQAQGGLARVVESVESGHSDHDFAAGVLSDAGVAGPRVRMDSQAKYVAVADGRAEVYLRHSVGKGYAEKIWDHAAGALLVEEAGGRVSDLNGKALDFSRGETLSDNHGILATNGRLHESLLEAIRRAG